LRFVSTPSDLPAAVQRVVAALTAAGLHASILVTPDSTRTAEQAAAVIGVGVGQIVKSMVLRAVDSDRAVLVLTSGSNRVDVELVAAEVGESVARADADFVRERTGYSIGGVPPLGHATESVVLADRDLLAFDEVWAAAGTPHAVFPAEPGALVTACGARVADVAAR
jgi:prolyl-tRNA editing enzyme YbaK/EbsC (Cys-tRNA(Pro) deacylase)